MTPNHANETFSQADLPALRKTMRERRKSLPTAIQQAHAKQAAIFFAAEFSKALSNRPLKIAIYSAVAGELDPAPLQHSIDNEGCEFYLPIIDKKQLRFGHIGSARQTNLFGIEEPDEPESSSIMTNDIDIIIVPLLAYDSAGNRLGMGGGYYDRTLAKTNNKKPLKIGYAHSLQAVNTLPAQPWDIPLDAVVNEHGAYRF